MSLLGDSEENFMITADTATRGEGMEDRLTFESPSIDVYSVFGPFFTAWIGGERLEFGVPYPVTARRAAPPARWRRRDIVSVYVLSYGPRPVVGYSPLWRVVADVVTQAPTAFSIVATVECEDIDAVLDKTGLGTARPKLREVLLQEPRPDAVRRAAEDVVKALDVCELYHVFDSVYINRHDVQTANYLTLDEVSGDVLMGDLVVHESGLCELKLGNDTAVVDYCYEFANKLTFTLW